ncbi:MAG: heavy-metal-associated domain-containing protein [Anaerolineae bacterium]|jgi:copper chaperone|nr:heavy-metal-associated domain-containing protein [Anaerolineae bacterium]
MQSKTFEVPNISCGHCAMTIQNEVGELEGVRRVEADKDTRVVTVEWDVPATWQQIEALLVEINYPPAPAAS